MLRKCFARACKSRGHTYQMSATCVNSSDQSWMDVGRQHAGGAPKQKKTNPKLGTVFLTFSNTTGLHKNSILCCGVQMRKQIK